MKPTLRDVMRAAGDRVTLVHVTADGPRVVSLEPDPCFVCQVQADDSGTWAGNALRFDTKEHAEHYARDLAGRWFLVRAWQVIEEPGPATHTWRDGRLASIGPAER